MRNAGLDKSQAVTKIAGRNINDLRYEDDATLLAESEEDHLLRNLYAGQEATVRTGHRTDWFQIGKGVCQVCIL